jgi:hypothetical protein
MYRKGRPGYNKHSLAAFSSRGPTYDGRRKPDVCGVGLCAYPLSLLLMSSVGQYLYNAASVYPPLDTVHANMDYFRGTSFSTPLLAAHAVLIRQYLLSGYYPSTTPQTTDQCQPSGALIKALFVHSTRSLSQIIYDEDSPSSTTTPRVEKTEFGDFLQGYGRVVLSDTLQFQETTGTTSPLSLYLIGCDPLHEGTSSDHRDEMIKKMTYTGEAHSYEVTITEGREGQTVPFKVTLTYTVLVSRRPLHLT